MKGAVLYIEDEVFFAKTISRKLTEHGFSVDTASDGTDGLAALREKTYNVVLLDLVLPHMSGFEVLEHMPALEKNAHTPVIVLSNLSSESDKQKAKELGAYAFHVKINSTPNEILAMVNDVIKKHHGT